MMPVMIKKMLIVITVLFSITVTAQEINFKKGVVFVDGKECLRYDDSDPNHITISDLDGNELVFLKFIHNSKYGDVYNKVTFIGQKVSFTSQSYIFSKKLLVKKLLADKTLTDCKLDPAKVETFVLKYDENIERG